MQPLSGAKARCRAARFDSVLWRWYDYLHWSKMAQYNVSYLFFLQKPKAAFVQMKQVTGEHCFEAFCSALQVLQKHLSKPEERRSCKTEQKQSSVIVLLTFRRGNVPQSSFKLSLKWNVPLNICNSIFLIMKLETSPIRVNKFIH